MSPPPRGAAAIARTPALEEHDPMLAALLAAPLADEPEMEEERSAFEAIDADIRAGRRGAGPEKIAMTLERMRLEHVG